MLQVQQFNICWNPCCRSLLPQYPLPVSKLFKPILLTACQCFPSSRINAEGRLGSQEQW